MACIFGWRLRPPTILYDEIGAAARNIHCYTVIGSWYWVAVGLMVRIETLLSIVCHRIFIIILGQHGETPVDPSAKGLS